ERAYLTTVYRDESEQLLVLAQRYPDITAGPSDADQRLEAGREADNLGFGEIRYRDRAFATDYTRQEISGREGPRDARDRGQVLCWHPVRYDAFKALAVSDIHAAEARLTQPKRFLQHCLEYRREVAGRGVDHLQYFSGRGLLLQRLARFGQEPRILH